MSNSFVGTGNLGNEIELREVDVNNEKRKVATLRVFFDEYKPDGNGGFEQTGGIWLNVSVWGRRAEQAAKLLNTRARVNVIGRLVESKWNDKDTGEERTGFQVEADEIYLSLTRLESITFRPPRNEDVQ